MKKIMKKWLCLLNIILIVFTLILGNVTVNAEPANHLLIYQLYGGGGKGDTPFTHSFIELYNPTTGTIDLTGWKITYSSTRESKHAGSTSGTEVILELEGEVPAGQSFLIRCKEETTSAARYNIPDGDMEWDRVIDNDATIELKLYQNTNYVDGISNRATDFNDIGEGAAPAQATSKQKSLRRTNFVDTDDNANDFTLLVWNDASVNQDFVDTYRPRSLADGAWTEAIGAAVEPIYPGLDSNSKNGKLTYVANYATGQSNKDGGVAEIVKYNKENQKIYLVNGAVQTLDIVSVKNIGTTADLTLEKRVDMTALAAANGFTCGDITSVSINTKLDVIAAAVQAETFTDNGCVVIMDYSGNYIRHFEAGSQPDMVTFTPDNKYCLTANEGEAREGYGVDTEDPNGSVTIIDMTNGVNTATAVTTDFTAYDAEPQRAELITNGVLIKSDTAPSVDLEPEYISVSADSRYAYVTLQEANAIATLDIQSKTFTSIKGLGFKDHSVVGNELDARKDGKAELASEDLLGVYMPDGCDYVSINGTGYILTANEGDAREWGSGATEYSDVGSYTFPGKTYKIDTLLNSEFDGLESYKTYIFGGRSFSIWNAQTMEQVYDSANDFEDLTSEWYPTCFNSTNTKTELDSRSGKKGPEPEEVKTLSIDNKIYAFIGLERIGGVMMYDITTVTNATFTDYINLRDYTGTGITDSGSLAPEGMCTVAAEDSPTGYPLLMVANEVSGNVDIIQINEGKTDKIASNVVTLINALPKNIALSDKTKVEAARASYNQLNDAQKGMVSNLLTLTNAEATVVRLANAAATAERELQTAVTELTAQINIAKALKKSDYTSTSYRSLKTALDSANKVNKKDITAVKNATQKLKNAIKQLTLAVPAKNTQHNVKGIVYKVTKSSATSGTVSVVKIKKSTSKVSIPDTIKLSGYTFKVTSVQSNAFKNDKKLTQISFGKYIETIGSSAFRNCQKLNKVTIKSEKLKTVSKNALKGIAKKAVIDVPNKKVSSYKKIFKNGGQAKTVKIK